MEVFSGFCSRNSDPTEWGFSGVENHRFFYVSQLHKRNIMGLHVPLLGRTRAR